MSNKFSISNSQFSKVLTRAVLLSIIVLLSAGCTGQSPEKKQDNTTSPTTQEIQQSSDGVTYEGVEGKNAFDLLKEKYGYVETKHYSFGDMVVAINGKRSEDGKNFWAFYVNGQQSPVGANQYVTKPGDKIEWKLEEIK